ncbi:MAG: prepilin-type N-terminal cleavage/methylation domain-containing protein [Gemmatimonadota bacterium]
MPSKPRIAGSATNLRLHGKRRTAFTVIELLAVMSLIGALSALAIPKFTDLIDRAKIARAMGDIKAIHTDILSQDSLPPSLAAINRHMLRDPWGQPYVYNKFPPGPPPGSARTDKFGIPVNLQFDLYSLGKDGASSASFSAAAAQDDIVKANDGGFVGLAKTF